ncbi:MAG: type II secretion system F family protein [Planctomycetaceae bacterium]
METAILITAGLILTAAAAAAVVQILRSWSGTESLETPIEGMYTTEQLNEGYGGGIGRFLRDAEIDLSLNEIIGWIASIAAVLFLTGSIVMIPLGWMLFLLIILLAIALGLLIVRRNNRLGRLRNQLPDVVSLMARSSRAGLAIEEAFLLCEKMSRGRLQSELQVCRSQLELGRSLSGVMESFARRVQLRELGLLSTLLSVHRQTGGSLADALDRLSSLLRDRIAFRGQMSASSAAGRLSALFTAPAATFLFAALLLINPEHVEIFFTTSIGRSFLALGIALNVVGVVWILGLIKISR